jgi:hypothetical protein
MKEELEKILNKKELLAQFIWPEETHKHPRTLLNRMSDNKIDPQIIKDAQKAMLHELLDDIVIKFEELGTKFEYKARFYKID